MLTEIQKDLLHRAIDSAKGYGECEYTEGAGPRCVIGHVAFLSGCSIDQIQKWGNSSVAIDEVVPNFGIDRQLLIRLQRWWDKTRNVEFDDQGNVVYYFEERARDKMHEEIDNWKGD